MLKLNPDVLDIVLKDVLENEVKDKRELSEKDYDILYQLAVRTHRAMSKINPILGIFSSPADFVPVIHTALIIGEALGRHGLESEQLNNLMNKEGA